MWNLPDHPDVAAALRTGYPLRRRGYEECLCEDEDENEEDEE